MAKILVVDDEKSIREVLQILLKRQNHNVMVSPDFEDAKSKLDSFKPVLVLTDLRLPGGTGIDILKYAKATDADMMVLMMTAFATTENAVHAMKLGAYDYIIKPFNVDEISVIISRALDHSRLKSQNIKLKDVLRARSGYHRLIGTSEAMQEIVDLIEKIARTNTTILISGESGTGKEVIARAIHTRGQKNDAPFVAINCGAIPEGLIESELFGHVKGSFTGATGNKIGLFEAASGGTLFLDEVGELSASIQVKLLRVLQERTIRKVGSTENVNVDCRIIAASNRVLEREVAEGRFREDLYFRLNVIEIPLPALRDRKVDIPHLADAFVAKYIEEQNCIDLELSSDALQKLMEWRWPGNIRELENVIERAVTLSADGESQYIASSALPKNIRDQSTQPIQDDSAPPLTLTKSGFHLETALETYERSIITQALAMTSGHKTKAADLLGLSFRSLRYRIAKLGIQDPDGPESQ